MIEVYADRIGDKCRLLAQGHADKGPERDVVCAGVSALVQSLLIYAKAHPALRRRLRYYAAPGEAFFSCCGIGEGFELVLQGLRAIAQDYEENLVIHTQSQLTTNERKRDIIKHGEGCATLA